MKKSVTVASLILVMSVTSIFGYVAHSHPGLDEFPTDNFIRIDKTMINNVVCPR